VVTGIYVHQLREADYAAAAQIGNILDRKNQLPEGDSIA
jgi:hypothetical protein